MAESLDIIEKELRNKKLGYVKKIDDLFKPYAQMTKEEIQRTINDPHYCSRKAEEYYKEIATIEKAEEELWWLRYHKKL